MSIRGRCAISCVTLQRTTRTLKAVIKQLPHRSFYKTNRSYIKVYLGNNPVLSAGFKLLVTYLFCFLLACLFFHEFVILSSEIMNKQLSVPKVEISCPIITCFPFHSKPRKILIWKKIISNGNGCRVAKLIISN